MKILRNLEEVMKTSEEKKYSMAFLGNWEWVKENLEKIVEKLDIEIKAILCPKCPDYKKCEECKDYCEVIGCENRE